MRTKYIFITGGVLSSLGKGLAAASIGAVIGDKDLAVREGAHCSGINVNVGVQLLISNPQSPTFQHGADGCRSQPFPQR